MKKILLYSLILLFIFIVGAASLFDFNPRKETKKLEEVTLAEVAHTIFYAPMYVAIENGYFKDNGINLNLVLASGADKVTAALLSGDADIGFCGSEATIYVYNGGEKDYLKTFSQLTKKDGTTKTVHIDDGVDLQFMWQGTSLGIKTAEQSEYTFVDLQGATGPVGPQGEAFQIKKTYATIQLMIADYDNMNINDYVMISGNIEQEDNAKLFVKTEVEDPTYRWQYLADFSGASGIAGPQGASVRSATINSNGELVMTVE